MYRSPAPLSLVLLALSMTEKTSANFRCWYFSQGEGLSHMALTRAHGAVADGRNTGISAEEIAEGCNGIVIAKDNGRYYGMTVKVVGASNRKHSAIWPEWDASTKAALWDVVPTSEIRELPHWVVGDICISGIRLDCRPRVFSFLQGRYDARIAEQYSALEDALGAAFEQLDGTPAGADLQEAGTLLLETLEQYL